MADLLVIAKTAEVALVAATTKTVLQIVAPSNHRLKVVRWGVSFDGVSVTDPAVVVELLRQTTAGTGGDALTLVKNDDSLAETIQSTALSNIDGSEPTAGDVLDIQNVHPQTPWEILLPMGQEYKVGGGDRLGIRCTAPNAVNVIAKIIFEE